MFRLSWFLILFASFSFTKAAFSGPYLFWGPQSLRNLDKHAFNAWNEEKFASVIDGVKILLIFSSNEFLKLNKNILPRLNEVINEREYLYTPETKVGIDLYDDRNKTKIIHIDARDSNLDITITDKYLSLERKYGTEKVLALLTGPQVTLDKKRIKREDTTEITPPQEEDDGPYIYNVVGKALFYTKYAPILRLSVSDTDEEDVSEKAEGIKEPKEVEYELKNHDLVTLDDRDQLSRLIVTFKLGEGYKVTLRFRFPLTLLTWSLTSVELEDSRGLNLVLPVVSIVPTAPIGFSHKCTHPLVFKNGTTTLTMFEVQVQPSLRGRNRFGDPYDCVGFTTIPIWSGILVSSLLLGGLAIAILAILDIRTPNKFENSKTKLTITNCD